jgi:lipopolysaccharide transport system ATP-binding protein
VNADIAAHGESVRLAPGHNVVRLQIDALYLNPGEYSIDLWVGEAGGSGFDHVERAFQLRVLDSRPVGTGATPVVTGLVPCSVRADVQRHDAAAPTDASR